MNKNVVLSIVSLSFFTIIACGHNDSNKNTSKDTINVNNDTTYVETSLDVKSDVPMGAQAIIKAYPEMGITYRDNKIWFKDSTSIVYDDGKKKDFITLMEEADVEDMFSLKYDRGERPEFQADCGRCRCDAFLKKMYGNSAAEVQKHLTVIDWYGKKVKVTTVNGVDKQLKALQEELKKYPELDKYFVDCGGTFNWRPVRGTKNRQSAHSYGMTMDINTKFSHYWLWDNKNVAEDAELKVYNNSIPKQIVDLFEKYGFIWGGHWYHYDTMHFEYRPDILIYNGINPVFVE